MHGEGNPENLIQEAGTGHTDGNRAARRRHLPQRLTYFGPGNPAYITPIHGETIPQYIPSHNDYTNQPFHLPQPPPLHPFFPWNPPSSIPSTAPQFWTPSYPSAPGLLPPMIPQPQFWNPCLPFPGVPLW